jgi:WD40 repeat protein
MIVLAWSSDGPLLATVDVGDLDPADLDDLPATRRYRPVRLWSADGTAMAELTGHAGPEIALAWSPNGQILASASFDGSTSVHSDEDCAVRLWGTDGTVLAELPGHTGKVSALAWSPDGQVLALANDGHYFGAGTVRLWGADGIALAELAGRVSELSRCPYGKKLE